MQNNRFDLYFSYWILLWLVFTILFYNKSILPFYSFILALLYHTTIVIYTFILHKKIIIILHIIIVLIIKIIPIIIIYNYYYNRINFREELVLFIILFGLYIIWKYIINNVDLFCEIKDFISNGIANDTPILSIINKKMITVFS